MLKFSASFLAACAVLTLFTAPARATDTPMPPAPTPVQSALEATPVVVSPPVAPTAPAALGDLIPPQGATPTEITGQLPATEYPILRMTPDKIEVVRLEDDAVNVLVGSSVHLLSVLETPRQIILIPRQPGATHFQVLNAAGKTIMERAVIIAAPKQDYVRVRRACATAGDGRECTEFSVYYCPDMCHQVAVTQNVQAGGVASMPDQTASTAHPADVVNDGVAMTNDTAAGASATANTIGAATGVQ